MKQEYTLRDAIEQVPTAMGMGMGMDIKMQEDCNELEFNTTMLPEIKNWQVGNEYLLVVKVVMTSSKIDDMESTDNQELEGKFDVKSVGAYYPNETNTQTTVKDKLNLR